MASMHRLHTHQATIDIDAAHRMVLQQFPRYGHLPIRYFHSSGTDHAIYRLGDEMYLRMPLTHDAQLQLEKELYWLPHLASKLPLSIPVPLEKGEPSKEFPHQWAIYTWLEGKNPLRAEMGDMNETARTLAKFIGTLQKIKTENGPLPGKHNFFRGVPLLQRDAQTRLAIESLKDQIDSALVKNVWDDALNARVWDSDPVWIHGDIHAANLLAKDGRITAVIDFGGLGVGDPACDLLVAWWFLTPESRQVFWEEVKVDEATWRRGRGWALSMAVIALPYYQVTNPVFAKEAEKAIREVISSD